MRDEARNKDQVGWPVTNDLVSDIDVAALRVVGFRGSHGLVNHLGHATEASDMRRTCDQAVCAVREPGTHRLASNIKRAGLRQPGLEKFSTPRVLEGWSSSKRTIIGR
jgi:hypothetical protein